jgi:hypothetical protein
MYSNDSFGGANRGPSTMRPPSRRSNAFVDVGFLALIIAVAGILGFQYYPLLSTTGYNVAAGHVERVSYVWGYTGYHSSYSRRPSRGDYFDLLKADYSFTTGGKTYHGSSISVPLVTFLSYDLLMLRDSTAASGLAVRYDPADPQKCVPVEVIDAFFRSALVTYICIFLVCSLFLMFAGMSNLSGEKWSPMRNSDVY